MLGFAFREIQNMNLKFFVPWCVNCLMVAIICTRWRGATYVWGARIQPRNIHAKDRWETKMGDVDKGAAKAGIAAGAAGAAGSVGTVAAAGSVAGLGATGITSGLAAVGGAVGGGMAAGLAVTVAAPVALAAVGYGLYKWLKD